MINNSQHSLTILRDNKSSSFDAVLEYVVINTEAYLAILLRCDNHFDSKNHFFQLSLNVIIDFDYINVLA